MTTGSIGQIYQTFGGQELYPSVEEKAAMLLYLVTKNHSFSDGNKRIAATLFLWFLNNNGILYRPDGSKRLADNTLVALTLMIAESKTEEKDVSPGKLFLNFSISSSVNIFCLKGFIHSPFSQIYKKVVKLFTFPGKNVS